MAQFERKAYRPEKIKAIDDLKNIINNSSVILTDFQGVDVVGMADIRKALKPCGATYKVVKNTLLTIAADDTEAKDLVKDLSGSTAIMYTEGDPVAATKALMAFTKTPKPIKIKSAFVEGQILDENKVVELSKTPSREELIASILGSIEAPIAGVPQVINALLSDLVFTIEAVADKKAAEA